MKSVKHPSGKPKHEKHFGVTSYLRVPNEGPLNPHLKSKELPPAIGFIAQLKNDCMDDE